MVIENLPRLEKLEGRRLLSAAPVTSIPVTLAPGQVIQLSVAPGTDPAQARASFLAEHAKIQAQMAPTVQAPAQDQAQPVATDTVSQKVLDGDSASSDLIHDDTPVL